MGVSNEETSSAMKARIKDEGDVMFVNKSTSIHRAEKADTVVHLKISILGNRPANLRPVSGCGCLSVRLDRYEVQPGETIGCTVRFAPRTNPAQNTESIAIENIGNKPKYFFSFVKFESN